MVASSIGCGSSGAGASSVLGGYPPAHIGSAADMEPWKTASAPGLVFASMSPLIAAGVSRGSNGTCPSMTTSGTTTTYQGGCSDANGNAWVGKAIASDASQTTMSGEISYEGFGFTGSSGGTATYNGTLIGSPGSGTIDYTLDVASTVTGSGSSDTTAISYSATVVQVGSGSTQMKTWNGTGEVGTKRLGKVSATTKDELIQNSACSYKPLSGTTTIVAGADTAVITYDGAGSCDQSETAPWTLDGTPQADLTNVSCNAGGATPGAVCGIVVALALTRRRRRPR